MIKKGDIIAIAQGEYSDYRLMCIAVALEDFDETEVARRYPADDVYPPKVKEYQDCKTIFLAGLLREGLIVEMDWVHLHIGSYTGLELGKTDNAPENRDELRQAMGRALLVERLTRL